MWRTRRRGSLPGEDLELIEDFGEVVRNARMRLGLTQEDLAKQINEKLTTIKKIEAGEFKPPIDLARKLEKFLRVRLLVPTEELSYEPSTKYVAKKSDFAVSLGDLIKKKTDRGSRDEI